VSTDKISKKRPDSGLKVVWKTKMNTGFSTFVVSKGKAFTLARVESGDKEACVAVDAETGKVLWQTELDNAKYDGGGDSGTQENRGGDGPRSTPSVDGNNVYALSALLKLYCLEAETGKTLWTKDLLKDFGGKMIAWQNAASPLIEGDLIFVNGPGAGQCLIALNKKDGSVAWKGQNDVMTQATPIAATLLGVRQVIFFTQNGLVSVVPTTGKELWRYAFPYSVSTAASPVVADDIVYCSAGYSVGAGAAKISKSGDTFTATELWRTPKKLESHWSTPVYSKGYLYGIFGSKMYGKAPLKCIEAATGKEMWSKDNFGPGGLLLVDDQLVVLDDSGTLVLVEASPKAYNEIYHTKAVDGKCWNAPSISEGRIYVRSTTEGACLDAR
jgi:outer membrane protein assembly factor BamB